MMAASFWTIAGVLRIQCQHQVETLRLARTQVDNLRLGGKAGRGDEEVIEAGTQAGFDLTGAIGSGLLIDSALVVNIDKSLGQRGAVFVGDVDSEGTWLAARGGLGG